MTRLSRFIHMGILLGLALVLMAPVVSDTKGNTGPTSLFLTVKGQNQGDIKGGVTQRGLENSIGINAWSHEVVSPRDAASGQATGKRQHKPFVITKRIDKATPKLYAALTQNEQLATVELKFFRPSLTTKAQELYFTVKLENAHISNITNRTDPTSGREVEEVSFTYQKITWTWVDGGITAQDDWEAPVV